MHGPEIFLFYSSESFSGFQNCRFKPRTWSWNIPKYLIKTLAHAGTKWTVPNDVYKYIYGHFPYYFTAEKNENRNQQEELGIIDLNQTNKLMGTSEITQPAPSTWPSRNLRGKKIFMPDLDTPHWQFSNTPEDKFQYQWTTIQLKKKHKSTTNKIILNQITWKSFYTKKKSIDTNKSEYPTGILAITFHKPAGEVKLMYNLDIAYRQFATHPRKSFRIIERWSY